MQLSDFRKESPLQRKVDQLITNFVVEDMSSLGVVECSQFRTLITDLAPNAAVMCRKTLLKRIVGRREK